MDKSAVTLMREILRNLEELEDRFSVAFAEPNGVTFAETVEETLKVWETGNG